MGCWVGPFLFLKLVNSSDVFIGHVNCSSTIQEKVKARYTNLGGERQTWWMGVVLGTMGVFKHDS